MLFFSSLDVPDFFFPAVVLCMKIDRNKNRAKTTENNRRVLLLPLIIDKIYLFQSIYTKEVLAFRSLFPSLISLKDIKNGF